MTTATHHQCPEINATNQRRRQLRLLQLTLAGAAAFAMLALFDAARPDITQSVPSSVRLTDMTVGAPLLASGPFGIGGFAADGGDDQAQLQQQQALQQMQQAEQQAEEQNGQAQQQAQQAEQQGQWVEQHPGP
jgi:hypothetical protein